MTVLKIFLFLLSPVTCIYYPGCPHVSQAKLRMTATCNGTTEYICLFDTNEQRYKEFCSDEKDIQSEGRKSVVRGSVDGIPCHHTRFQPFRYSTNIGPECVFIKSSCNGEGQIVSNDGSPTDDVTCKCDYREGYIYIKIPEKNCSCNPNQEDCSCYLIHCNSDEILTQDYRCLLPSQLTGNYKCEAIEKTKSNPQIEIAEKFNLYQFLTEYQMRKFSQNIKAVTVFLILVVGISIGMTIVYTVMMRSNSLKIGKPDITVTEEYINSLVGDNITLTCHVFANPPSTSVVWQKYENGKFINIKDVESFITKRITTTLVLDSVQQNSSGLYFCSAINKVGYSRSKAVCLSVNKDYDYCDNIKDISSQKRKACRIGRKRYVSC